MWEHDLNKQTANKQVNPRNKHFKRNYPPSPFFFFLSANKSIDVIRLRHTHGTFDGLVRSKSACKTALCSLLPGGMEGVL